jgi:hypothetical protein
MWRKTSNGDRNHPVWGVQASVVGPEAGEDLCRRDASCHAYAQAVATFNSLTYGSTLWQVEEAAQIISAAATFVTDAEGKSEQVRYAVELVVKAL